MFFPRPLFIEPRIVDLVGNNSFSRAYKILLLAYWQGLITGGLPTFVDVGNSFGAPAIVKDPKIRR
ncbi:alkaline-phosphatase family protein, putative [Medicago truncatula]|uniref:Alkaline-phosphatase family protein, putative n=1 Tax=Medicago truncatula TaxID=3880 RepID=G7IL32_MEDTR|nr:alkaline-phosphatase family protein, putative [Medicago truncatula]